MATINYWLKWKDRLSAKGKFRMAPEAPWDGIGGDNVKIPWFWVENFLQNRVKSNHDGYAF